MSTNNLIRLVDIVLSSNRLQFSHDTGASSLLGYKVKLDIYCTENGSESPLK